MSSTKDQREKARGARVKEIREARGEDQPTFGLRMDEEARALGFRDAPKYAASVVSRIEHGLRTLTPDDLQVIARLDKEGRGEDWIAWGVRERKLTPDEIQRALAQAEQAARRRGGKGAKEKGA